MRRAECRFAAFIVLFLLLVSTGCADAQTDGHGVPWGVWGTVGAGSARFAGAKPSVFPPAVMEGWLTVGPVALGLRRIVAGAGGNTTERIEDSWLLGARKTLGQLLLVVGAGKATVSGRNSNGEQSGTTSPIDDQRAWTAEAELTAMLGRYVGIGAAAYRTGNARMLSRGVFLILQAGRLR
jgi:hypothetical protein